MSELETERQVLSREELDALLATLAEPKGAGERRSSRPYRGLGAGAGRPGRLSPLLRAFDEFAEELGRGLSTLYQAPLSFSLLEWEELTPREWAATLLPTDAVIEFHLEPGGHRGQLLLSRPLAFAWLALAFGARPGHPETALPTRAYSRIEERFLRRAAREVVRQLGRTLRDRWPLELKAGALRDAEHLIERGGRSLLVASFDTKGLGELGRVRLALPPGAFDAAVAEEPQARGAARPGVEASLLTTEVAIRVEAGHAELSLARLASLAPGDVIPIEAADRAGLLVRIEGEPRFRAQRGHVGRRLAVQLTGRV